MLFSIGVETPKSQNEAFGLIVPALCNDGYSCFSAADDKQQLVPAATDVITTMVEEMLSANIQLSDIVDKGISAYQQSKAYEDYDVWLTVEYDPLT
ncbi:MAG: hypothetical protein ACI8WB_005694 [Phenylobacterium sp.]|jgi:hypothetical protein